MILLVIIGKKSYCELDACAAGTPAAPETAGERVPGLSKLTWYHGHLRIHAGHNQLTLSCLSSLITELAQSHRAVAVAKLSSFIEKAVKCGFSG